MNHIPLSLDVHRMQCQLRGSLVSGDEAMSQEMSSRHLHVTPSPPPPPNVTMTQCVEKICEQSLLSRSLCKRSCKLFSNLFGNFRKVRGTDLYNYVS